MITFDADTWRAAAESYRHRLKLAEQLERDLKHRLWEAEERERRCAHVIELLGRELDRLRAALPRELVASLSEEQWPHCRGCGARLTLQDHNRDCPVVGPALRAGGTIAPAPFGPPEREGRL